MTAHIEWNADGFEFGDFRFLPVINNKIATAKADYPSFILMKDGANVAAYAENLTGAYRNVLELGIMRGGSCAFFEALLAPENHLAIDIHRFEGDGLEQLASYVESKGRCFISDYNTSQTDIGRIFDLWGSLAGTDEALDLIIDDASHSYDLSLASFNGLFPHLRTGGIYVLEDWGWAHWMGPWQDHSHSEYANLSLSNLVVQAALSVTGGSGMIESVKITPNAAFITRGQNPSKSFAVEKSFVARGRNTSPF